jgi:hypothetical protein
MDLDRLETVCEWTKSRATERGRVRVAERADDLANIAHLEKKLMLRQSPFAEPIGQAVQQTIQQSIQELQQHASDPEVQETISQAQQSVTTVGQALSQLQQFGQAPPMGQAQPAGQAQPVGQTPPASPPQSQY